MAHRLPRLFLAATLLLLAAQRSDAQSPGQPMPPTVADKPKPPEPPAAAKELSAQEVVMIEKALGAKETVHAMSTRFFAFPVKADDDSRNTVSEFRLYVKSPDVGWKLHDQGGPDTVRLVCKVEQTGLHLIALMVVDKAGEKTIPDTSRVEVERATQAKPAPAPLPGPITAEKAALLPPVPIQFAFKFDPKTPIANLLPVPLKTIARLPSWTNEDLAKVPELTFGQPISKDSPKNKAMEATANVMAKINHLNLKKTDGFMLALIDNRPDLRGLPFLMGDDCRMREDEAKAFLSLVETVRQAVAQCKSKTPFRIQGGVGPASSSIADQLWSKMGEINSGIQRGGFDLEVINANNDQATRATVAALQQILMPEATHFRLGLAKFLGTIPHIDATKALAKLAIFSPEDEVRAAAIDGLKTRRERDYTDILLQGFRYPLPAVSKRAADAIVKLDRKDLLTNLIDVLERPDPRLPVSEKRDGKQVTFVRELVRVNHHRNCLLCHAPGNTDNAPEGVLKVAVPLPGEPLPKPAEGSYQSTPPPSPDIVVRIDMTYLRQDFSLMMPVRDAHPWPEMQRFDFLVRTRELTPTEAQAYEPCCEMEEPGRLSPYHRAALYALRELTGRDCEPTAAAWRKLLKLPK